LIERAKATDLWKSIIFIVLFVKGDKQLKREYRIILKGVLLNKSNEERKEIDSLLDEFLSWKEIAGILFTHRLGGYFFYGLTENQQKKLPIEIREVLKSVVKVQKEKQLEIAQEIKLVNEELMKSNIHFAALKGAFFSSEMYELGARRSNDIDLLVYEKDLEDLDICLRKMGYIQSFMTNGQMVEASKKEKLIQRMNYHDLVPYVKEGKNGNFELDINFLFDNNRNCIDKLVYDMGTTLYDGKNYRVTGLNYYTNLAHLCSHFYREATNTLWTEGRRDVLLYKVVDIMNYIRYYRNKLKIEKMYTIFKELNLLDKAYYTFKILLEFYNDEFIAEMLNLLKKDINDEEFMNQIYDFKNKTIILRKESFFESAFECGAKDGD